MEHIMLIFDNGAEDVGIFPASTLSAIEAGNDVVNLHFGQHANKHIVVLETAADESDLVAAAISKELVKKYNFAGRHNTIVVADDTNSVYITDGVTGAGVGIEAVTSIGVDDA